MKVAATLKSKEGSAKKAAEKAESNGEQTLKKLERELKIKTQMKSCKRDRNALRVKISDHELKKARLERSSRSTHSS